MGWMPAQAIHPRDPCIRVCHRVSGTPSVVRELQWGHPSQRNRLRSLILTLALREYRALLPILRPEGLWDALERLHHGMNGFPAETIPCDPDLRIITVHEAARRPRPSSPSHHRLPVPSGIVCLIQDRSRAKAPLAWLPPIVHGAPAGFDVYGLPTRIQRLDLREPGQRPVGEWPVA